MGTPSIGAVVLVPFPFSDLSTSKLRPAVVAAHAEFGDVVLCQITSRLYSSKSALALNDHELSSGQLNRVSFIRTDKLFTANPVLVVKSVAQMKEKPLARLRQQIANQFLP